MNKNLIKDIHKGKYEKTESGLYIPGANVKIGGHFITTVNGTDEQIDKNIVVNEGLNYLLGAAVANRTVETSWYIGLFSGNYTPQDTDTAANISANSTEIQSEVTETTRQAYTLPGADPTGESITNSASPAVFNANTTVNAYGAFLVSVNTMGGTTGKLLAASKFSAVRALVNTDVLNVTYQLDIADA